MDFETLFGSSNDSAAGETTVTTVVMVSPRMVSEGMRDTLNYLRSTNPPNLMFTAEVTTTYPVAAGPSMNEVRLE